MIFLDLAANYHARDILRHSFCYGTKHDYDKLEALLASRYGGLLKNTSLVYSGRTAISLALKSFIESGRINKNDHVAVNSFTCYAVVQAIKHAGLIPVFVDLEKLPSGEILPNYSASALENFVKKDKLLKVFILQNTFGLSVDIDAFLSLKEKYNLLLLEDLAHCTGRFYKTSSDKKLEIGTVGDATCLSFGKGKSVDAITGGAIILRDPTLALPKSFKKDKLVRRECTGDAPRASWYPLFAVIARGLSHLHLEKFWLGFLLKFHWIERSADTRLDEKTSLTHWQAKLALRQMQNLKSTLLREYYLVDNRDECLKELKSHGFRLDEFWYGVPVAPKRYFDKVDFPSDACPNAVYFANHVINLPTCYLSKKRKKEVSLARHIIQKYEVKYGK